MMNVPENFNFDVRVRERLLRKGVISQSEVTTRLGALKNLESEYVVLDLEQPVLQRSRAESEPEREPVPVAVLPVRSGNTELPPPPPGLIKETFTAPFPGVAFVEAEKQQSAPAWSAPAEVSEPDLTPSAGFAAEPPSNAEHVAPISTPGASSNVETADDDAWGVDT